MAGEICAHHEGVAALYRCDGCGSHLCKDCVDEGHALLLCQFCGERALPLHAEQPATTREVKRRRTVAKPYSLKEALGYPFRGSGKYLYVATLLVMAFLFVIPSLILRLIFAFLLAALQLKIVESTANGDNELPDWPDLMEVGERFWDFLTWLTIYLMQFVVLLPVVFLLGRRIFLDVALGDFSGLQPSLPLWLGVAAALWLGTALSTMAFGAAGAFGRPKVLAVHNHVRGFFLAGRDAVVISNMIFGFGALVFLVRQALGLSLPLVSAPLSGALGAYWLFVNAHLPGVLFRRHLFALEELYC